LFKKETGQRQRSCSLFSVITIYFCSSTVLDFHYLLHLTHSPFLSDDWCPYYSWLSVIYISEDCQHSVNVAHGFWKSVAFKTSGKGNLWKDCFFLLLLQSGIPLSFILISQFSFSSGWLSRMMFLVRSYEFIFISFKI
jgi:hypothetical protein